MKSQRRISHYIKIVDWQNDLMEFLEVFAESEFDLGAYRDKQHGINTANAEPVKQHIRRNPAYFRGGGGGRGGSAE